MPNSPTQDPHEARLYPAGQPLASADAPKLGICLSGGGSRALTCALGQLSGLRSLPDPGDAGRTLLERADYLSSVSGGSWAAVLYTFLPGTIDGQAVGDDEFLITPTAPGVLKKKGEDVPDPANVAWLHRHCLGNAPQQWRLTRIAELLYTLYRWEFFDHPERWRWFWIAAVGELILKPFALYDAEYDPGVDVIQPARAFSLSAEHILETITPANPTLTPNAFYTARSDRTPLFVNTNVLQRPKMVDSPQVPVQATPVTTGLLGRSPDERLTGGGGVESFGFTSQLLGPGGQPETASIGVSRNYSLCDIAGCSSAFFAEGLLGYLNEAIDDLIDEIERVLTRKLHFGFLARRAAARVRRKLEPFLDCDASQLIPHYNYWPLGSVADPDNTTYGFSDGGDFENTGILGMLARSDADRLISFVNSLTPLSRDPDTDEVMVAGQLAGLFGYRSQPEDGRWVSWGGMSPHHPMSFAQVFSDRDDEFSRLRQGLYEASCGGAGRDSDLGTFTAAFSQSLETVDNPVAHIQGGRRVQVLWVYNNRVNRWQDSISDNQIRSDLTRGQANQNPDGTPLDPPGKAEGPVKNFPWYRTGSQIEIDKEGVNMLAQLSAWNVREIEPLIASLIADD